MHPPGSRMHARAKTLTTFIFGICGVFIVYGLIRAVNQANNNPKGHHLHMPHLSLHILGTVNETQQQLQSQVTELQAQMVELQASSKQHSAQSSQLSEHLIQLQKLEEQVAKLQTQVDKQGDLAAAGQSVQQPQQAVMVKAEQEDPCALANIMPRKELWGAVVAEGRTADGNGGIKAASAQECCRACQQHASCNQWVWCWNSKLCGQECWLKREGDEAKIAAGPEGAEVRWTSGYLKRGFNVDPASLPPVNDHINIVALKTQYGKIRIQLKPEWHAPSVEYVRRLAQNPALCGAQCRLYRAEPGFLLQGTLESAIPPNKLTQPGPKIMEKGEIGWAGGGAGPHWFVYVGDHPAEHFGTSHTVWGVLADQPSMQVVQDILALPSNQAKPGDMRFLNETVQFAPTAEL